MVMSIISSVLSLILVISSAIGLGLSGRRSSTDVVTACWAIMLLSGLGQAITTIISSGFACRAICCRSASGGRIIYVPRDDHQDIIRNNGNRFNGATALTGKILQLLIVILFSIEQYVIRALNYISEIKMSHLNFLFLDNPPSYQEAGCTSTQSKTTSPEEVNLLL